MGLLSCTERSVPAVMTTTHGFVGAHVGLAVASGLFVAVRRRLAGVTERLLGDPVDGVQLGP